MKQVTVTLSDEEWETIKPKSSQISYEDIKRSVLADMFKSTVKNLHVRAQEAGISEMSMEEIDELIKEVRREAKNNS